MAALGYLSRRVSVDRQFAWYLLALVVFAPAIANQYLVIPLVGIAMLGPVMTYLPYLALCSLWLYVFSVDGPKFFWHSDYFQDMDKRQHFYDPLVFLLLAGVAWQVARSVWGATTRRPQDPQASPPVPGA
jgi:hypothetical protein